MTAMNTDSRHVKCLWHEPGVSMVFGGANTDMSVFMVRMSVFMVHMSLFIVIMSVFFHVSVHGPSRHVGSTDLRSDRNILLVK